MLNREGVQYVLGSPTKNDPFCFSQVILPAGELGWLNSGEADVIGFSSLADAQRARQELRGHGKPLCVYQVSIKRLAEGT